MEKEAARRFKREAREATREQALALFEQYKEYLGVFGGGEGVQFDSAAKESPETPSLDSSLLGIACSAGAFEVVRVILERCGTEQLHHSVSITRRWLSPFLANFSQTLAGVSCSHRHPSQH